MIAELFAYWLTNKTVQWFKLSIITPLNYIQCYDTLLIMGCHTWFFRPIKENEKADDTCEYSEEKYDDDRYTNCDTPHDLFRIGGYPEVFLLSLEETLTYIEEYKDKMSFPFTDWEEKVTEFWDKNPNGVIEFG